MKILLFFLLLCSTLLADEAHEIMKKIDNNMRGQNIYMKMAMIVHSQGHTRTMKMKSWSKGTKKSFVKTIYPPKDKGITFLSLDNQMWQYVPKIERVIKIPPSMMLQNWMGSDITNDDVVKQSSIVEDYDPKILSREGDVVTIELIPKEDAPVVWGKIVSRINTKTYTSEKDIFYDEEGDIVRTFYYSDVTKNGKYYIPTYWKLQPKNKPKNYTEIRLEDVVFDQGISEKYFRKSALKRFSR
jgi:outer membrane lipoprotein-sorting protein